MPVEGDTAHKVEKRSEGRGVNGVEVVVEGSVEERRGVDVVTTELLLDSTCSGKGFKADDELESLWLAVWLIKRASCWRSVNPNMLYI